MNKRLSDQAKLDLVLKYMTGTYSCARLAREYGVTTAAINGLLRRRHITILNDRSKLLRKYHLDESFFDVIDTEPKAYFLGLLYADGCNYQKRNCIRLGLQESDRHILDQFNQCLKSNRPLYYVKLEKHGSKNQYALAIVNKHMSEQLAKIGCISKKSLILKWPQEDIVPHHLQRHFIRGYFDGDGSFTKSPNKKYSGNIISTLEFCLVVKSILSEHDIKSSIYKTPKSGDKNTVSLNISGRIQVGKFLNWLYQDCQYFIKRKYDKYLEIQKDFNI